MIENLAQLAEILGCSGCFNNTQITGFETDSRLVKEGTVFVALRGKKVDGHRFLEDVAKNKAAAAVVASDYRGEDFGLPLLMVDDVLAAIQEAARKIYAARKVKAVAVTGSVGKTTTKEFIATLLEGKFRVFKTPASANSQVGIPMSILNWNGKSDVCVFEMAMSEPGHIRKLIEIAPPDMAVLTKIGVSHAAFFKDGVEGIAAAKAEIFSHPNTRLAIVNGSASHFQAISQLKLDRIYFGDTLHAEYRIEKVEEGVVVFERGKRSPVMTVSLEASHMLENFCAAVVVARQLGLTWDEISAQASKLRAFKRRFEKIEKKGVTYFNDSFNASPESVCAALKNLPVPKGKRIAVLGEMKELGAYSESGHGQVAECALLHVDHLLCFGKGALKMVDIFQQHRRSVEYFESFESMSTRLNELAVAGDVVLVKGANSDAMWRLVEESS
jgi:UDP-N-acetylmuramoyl-tripeptide--D-alanyl-D-alanine ligase